MYRGKTTSKWDVSNPKKNRITMAGHHSSRKAITRLYSASELQSIIMPIAMHHHAEAVYYVTSDNCADLNPDAELIVYVVGSKRMGIVDLGMFQYELIASLDRRIDINYIGHSLSLEERMALGGVEVFHSNKFTQRDYPD